MFLICLLIFVSPILFCRSVRRRLQIDSATQELNLSEDITGEVEVLIKYDGYIARQEQQVEATEKLEKYKIPVDIDYSKIKHISTETKEKLEKIRPTNLAQASRIGGVKPADISVLMVLYESIKAYTFALFKVSFI